MVQNLVQKVATININNHKNYWDAMHSLGVRSFLASYSLQESSCQSVHGLSTCHIVFHEVRTPTHGEADTVYHEVSIPWGQNPHTWGGWHCIPCGQKPTHDTTSAYLPSSRCLKKKCRQRQTTLYEVSRHKPAVFLEDSTRDRDMLENALAL